LESKIAILLLFTKFWLHLLAAYFTDSLSDNEWGLLEEWSLKARN